MTYLGFSVKEILTIYKCIQIGVERGALSLKSLDYVHWYIKFKEVVETRKYILQRAKNG